MSRIRRDLNLRYQAQFLTSLPLGIYQFNRLFRRLGIDLVHTNIESTLDAGIAAKLAGLPHISHFRGNTTDSPKPVFDLLTAIMNWDSDLIFAISEATAGIFRRRGYDSKVQVLYNAIELSRFTHPKKEQRVNTRKEWGISPSAPVIGSVGRIHPRKHYEPMLRAFPKVLRRFPEARMVIVGPAEQVEERAYKASLVELSKSLGITSSLIFVGWRADVETALAGFDLFCITSLNEGFGRVVAEAMAAGLPVVASRMGALPELVLDGETGLLSEPDDVHALGQSLVKLLASPGLRKNLGRSGRERSYQLFDATRQAEELRAVYEALLAPRQV